MLILTKCRNVESPFKSTPESGAWDFCIPNDFMQCMLMPGEGIAIPSGIKAIVPAGHAFIAYNKSGIAKNHLIIKTSEFVDADYHGEIHLAVYNAGKEPYALKPGEPLVQFALHVVNNSTYTMLDQATFNDLVAKIPSQRGEMGFGEATQAYLRKQMRVKVKQHK